MQARVTNIGQINDQFNIEVGGLPTAWYSRSVPGMRLLGWCLMNKHWHLVLWRPRSNPDFGAAFVQKHVGA